jgi:hypothetical protein
MTPVWSTIVKDSTSTPDIYKQTISAVDSQWNIPQHPKSDTTPPHERKRARFTDINRKSHTGRGRTSTGRGRTNHTQTPNPPTFNNTQPNHPPTFNNTQPNHNWYDANNNKDDWYANNNKNDWYGESPETPLEPPYSESQEIANDANMAELEHLERMVQNSKQTRKDLKDLVPTTDTERDVVQDYDQMKLSPEDKTFLEGLPLSQRRWDGPTDTPKDHKTIYKRIFHYVVHYHSNRLHEYEQLQVKCAYSATPDPIQLEKTIHQWTIC